MVDELKAPEESHKEHNSSNFDNVKTNKPESPKQKAKDMDKSSKESGARAQTGQSTVDAAGKSEAANANASLGKATSEVVELGNKTKPGARISSDKAVTDKVKSSEQVASDAGSGEARSLFETAPPLRR